MKVSELYQSRQTRIQPQNTDYVEKPLTISEVDIVGKERQGILLSFEETELKHKCNRTDAVTLTKLLKTDETDDFVGKKITLVAVNNLVRIQK